MIPKPGTDHHFALAGQEMVVCPRFLLLLALWPAFAWGQGSVDDIAVRLHREGPVIVVEVDCDVDAPALLAWEVLTDYAHMARFLSNLDSSVVDVRNENRLRVHQVGRASQGPFSLAFDNVREVELFPPAEVRSRFMNGDFKDSTYITRIVQAPSGIRIVNRGRYVTGLWIPPLIGPLLVAAGIRRQFGEIRDEILRRHALASPPS